MAVVYYTLDDISKNNGENDSKTWIIVKHCVYDVTDYIKQGEHPGGVELIEEWAGKDASRDFNNAGHSGDAKAELKKYKIGEVAEEDRNKKQVKVKANTKAKNGKSENTAKSFLVTNGDEKLRRSCMSIISCGLIA